MPPATQSPSTPGRLHPDGPPCLNLARPPAGSSAQTHNKQPIALPILPRTLLATRAPQMRLNNWRLVRGRIDILTPGRIIGALVQTAQGHTSPITHVDPISRRVRTRSGSIYELGTPEMAFERIAPEVMDCLGF